MLISVKVKPGSKKGPKIEKISDQEYIVYLRERAHDGQANEALIRLLAEYFHVAKTTITIKSGYTSRTKLIEF